MLPDLRQLLVGPPATVSQVAIFLVAFLSAESSCWVLAIAAAVAFAVLRCSGGKRGESR